MCSSTTFTNNVNEPCRVMEILEPLARLWNIGQESTEHEWLSKAQKAQHHSLYQHGKPSSCIGRCDDTRLHEGQWFYVFLMLLLLTPPKQMNYKDRRDRPSFAFLLEYEVCRGAMIESAPSPCLQFHLFLHHTSALR